MAIATMRQTLRENEMNAHRKIAKTAAETTLAEQFSSGGAVASERASAFAVFAAKGLPTRREEAWHYTDLRALWKSAAPGARAPDAAATEAARALLPPRELLPSTRIVMLDGRYVAELSDAPPPGVRIGRDEPARAVAVDDSVLALNRAMATGGCAIAVSADDKLDRPIEVFHLTSANRASAVYSSTAIDVAAGANVVIIERFIGGSAAGQRNVATFLDIAAGAKAAHVVDIADAVELHLESQVVTLAARAEFNGFALVSGGALARRQIFATLAGPKGKVALGGLALLDGQRHADTTLVVDHAAPNGVSREFYKHIVADDAIGVYQGKVIVRPGAQKTDGGMKSQAILLSPHAVMNNKPELEIFADNVVCGHGATVGALDPEQLFYLQARGIPKGEAEAILLEAFGAEAIDRFGDAAIGETLKTSMRAWLARRTGVATS
jgi:Fe-S cluster assembly protein SufD